MLPGGAAALTSGYSLSSLRDTRFAIALNEQQSGCLLSTVEPIESLVL